MVVGVVTGKGFRGAIGYALKDQKQDKLKPDQKPEIIKQNNVYGNAQQMASQMRFVSNTNNRVSVPVMHFYVSFDAKEKLTEAQQQKAVNGVLKELGVKNTDHQYLIVKHNDAKNPHYHIILNKVDLDGKKLNVGFEGKKEEFIANRCHVVADKIEQEQGLKRTEGRKILYDPNNPKGYRKLSKEELKALETRNKKESISKNPHKREQEGKIKSEVNAVLQNKAITSPDQFKKALEGKGIDVRFSENKNGISGVSFKNDKISISGTKIGAKWSDISNVLNENKQSATQEHKLTKEESLRHLKADLHQAISLSISVGSPNIRYILENRGFKYTNEGYLYNLKGNDLLIKSNLEKVVSKALSERKNLFNEYNKQKEKENEILKLNPKEIKPVPFLFGGKVKEENAKSENFNQRLAAAKENIKQNPVKAPVIAERQVLKKHVDHAFNGDIFLLEAKPQEKELSRFEQIKAQRDQKEQDQERNQSQQLKR